MSVSPEMMTKVAEWRNRAREGKLTQDEMKEAIKFLRAERLAMPPSTTAKKKPPVDAAALLGELGL